MNSKSSFFEEIREFLANDELDIALKRLQVFLKKSKTLDEVILHSARYNDVMKQIRMDTISFKDANLKKNKIRYALIDIVGIIEDEAEDNSEINKEIERIEFELSKAVQIKKSKNVNTGNINTGGGNFIIGDNNF